MYILYYKYSIVNIPIFFCRSASRPMPSLVILDKLKEEMRKLSEMRKAVVAPTALGKFVPPLVVATAGGDCGGVGLATTK